VKFWEYNHPILRGHKKKKDFIEYGTFHFKGLWLSREGEGLPKDILIGSSS
jgi:hypothetical protein